MSLTKPKTLFGSNYDNTDITSLPNEECQPIFNPNKSEFSFNNNVLPKSEFYNNTYSHNYINGKEVSIESGVYTSAKQFCMSYTIKHTIGKGNFSIVKYATHTVTGQPVAIKIIDKIKLSSENLEKVHREIKVMKKLNHKNIVNLYQVFESENIIYIIMEYVPHGELFEFINSNGPIKEKKAKSIFLGILSAVEHCHLNNVVHRDLKAENLLLDSKMNIKLADFGFSTFNTCFSESHSTEKLLITWCGSPPYAAPEIFRGDPYAGSKADIWSMGVVLYVMVCGTLPFDGHTLAELKAQVIRGNFQIPFWLSHDCENLIRKMLSKSPTKRPTITEIRSHQWFNEIKKSQSNEETLSALNKSNSNNSIKVMTTSAHQSLSHSSSTNSSQENGNAKSSNNSKSSSLNVSSDDMRIDFRDGHFNETALNIMERNGLSKSLVLESLHARSYDHLTAIYLLLCEKLKKFSDDTAIQSNLLANGKILSTLSLNNQTNGPSPRPASFYKKSFTPVPDSKVSNSSLNYKQSITGGPSNPEPSVLSRKTLDPQVYRRRPLSQVTHKAIKTDRVLRIYGDNDPNPTTIGLSKTPVSLQASNPKSTSNKQLILNTINNNSNALISGTHNNGFYSLKTDRTSYLPITAITTTTTNARLSPYENEKNDQNGGSQAGKEDLFKSSSPCTPIINGNRATIHDNNLINGGSVQTKFQRNPSSRIPQMDPTGYHLMLNMEPKRTSRLKEIPQWIKASNPKQQSFRYNPNPHQYEMSRRPFKQVPAVYSNNATHAGPVIIVNAGGPYNHTSNQGL